MWNPFKRHRAPEPEQQPAAPAAPAEQPAGGLLRRLGNRLRPGRAKAPKPQPKQKPAAPPSAPAGGGGGAGGAGGGAAGGGGGEGEQKPARQYPKGLGVTIEGVWQISDTEWDGIMQGVLRGDDVQAFLEAMETGDEAEAVRLVATVYDENVGSLLNAEGSSIRRIDYNH